MLVAVLPGSSLVGMVDKRARLGSKGNRTSSKLLLLTCSLERAPLCFTEIGIKSDGVKVSKSLGRDDKLHNGVSNNNELKEKKRAKKGKFGIPVSELLFG